MFYTLQNRALILYFSYHLPWCPCNTITSYILKKKWKRKLKEKKAISTIQADFASWKARYQTLIRTKVLTIEKFCPTRENMTKRLNINNANWNICIVEYLSNKGKYNKGTREGILNCYVSPPAMVQPFKKSDR